MREKLIEMRTMSPTIAIAEGRLARAALSLALATAALAAAALVAAAPARAEFDLVAFDGGVFNEDGTGTTQAGGRPHSASVVFRFTEADNPEDPERPLPDGQMRNVSVDLPPGFVGNPNAVPKCDIGQLRIPYRSPNRVEPSCPENTQIGFVELIYPRDRPDLYGGLFDFPLPLYNIDPPPGVPAQFAFNADFGGTVVINASLRSESDYGITTTSPNIPDRLNVVGAKVTVWGEPASDDWNDVRGSCAQDVPPGDSCPSNATPKAFLANPTDCSTGPVRTHLRAESWQGGDTSGFFDSHLPPSYPLAPGPLQGPTGCERLEFEPSISVQPTSTQPDAPTGLDVELTVPQNDDLDRLATAHLEQAVVTLPEGMTVNPSSAGGLEACSSAQIGLDNRDDPTCPEASKIGTVEVDTPLLAETMQGSVYVAKQGDNPFRSLLAIYIVAKGPGVIVKLPGHVQPDPVTGRLTTTFDDNPPLPFTSFRVSFKDGPRAPLANPPTCGMKVVETSFTPYSAYPEPPAARVADPAKVAHPSDTFNIDCPGVSAFAPAFTAGTLSPVAGSFSPFAVRIDRPDGQQYMRGLSLETPPGFIANLRGVPLCPDAQANAGTCDPGSKIGTAVVGAGAGSPFFTAPEHGSVYLTEGYKGAPFGLSTAVRAIAGPYDLGTVVVRQAIFVDRTDAHITVVSDPIPTILEGIPLRIRSINVDVNRPRFTINPTSCREKQIRATMTSIEGTVHQPLARFQVGNCQALRLRPRFSMRLLGRRQMREGGHPGLRTVLRQGAGQANMTKVAAKLPLSLALDPENAQSDALCEFEAGQRGDCPASSIIGRAVAHTPVLNRPLRGPVHFVKNVRIHPRTGRQIRTLPTLLIPLRGEVAIDVRAHSDVIDQKLVSTFQTVPDAPVSRFVLTLKGGRKGILVATRNICNRRRSHVTEMEIDGHNGKRADQAVRMRTACPKKKPARLRVRKARWQGDRLAVSGRVAKAATRRVKVTASCGKATASKRAKPKRGHWKTTLTLPGRCASARRAGVTAIYPGGPRVRRARAVRRVAKPSGWRVALSWF